MNKIAIPVILAATVMVAGIFAFMPVEQATTVHTTILASTERLIVEVEGLAPVAFAAADANACLGPATGTGVMDLAIFVTDNIGTPIAGLVVGDFSFAFVSEDGGGAVTADIAFADEGGGLYTIGFDGDADLGADGVDFAYAVTVDVDDADNSATTLTGSGFGTFCVVVVG